MPKNMKLWNALIKRYGKKKGEDVYYGMETKGHPATKPSAIRKAMRG